MCILTQFLIDQIPSSSQSPKTMQINSNVNSEDSIESEDEDVEIDFMYGNEGDLKGNEEDFNESEGASDISTEGYDFALNGNSSLTISIPNLDDTLNNVAVNVINLESIQDKLSSTLLSNDVGINDNESNEISKTDLSDNNPIFFPRKLLSCVLF